MELYNKGLALQQKGDYIASEEAYNELLNSALVKEVRGVIFKWLFNLTSFMLDTQISCI